MIIPTLNEEKYLPALLSSLKQQTLRPKEIIVVDAGSKDNTLKCALSNSATVVNGGRLPGYSRNIGAKIAKSEWLLFLDADVHFSSSTINRLSLEQQSKAFDAASCWFSPEPKTPLISLVHHISNYYFLLSSRLGWPHSIGGFLFVKKSLHHAIGGFNTDIKVAEDQDYVNRLRKEGKYLFLRTPVVMISSRRFLKEGILATSLKWILIEIHRIFLNEIETNKDFRHF